MTFLGINKSSGGFDYYEDVNGQHTRYFCEYLVAFWIEDLLEEIEIDEIL